MYKHIVITLLIILLPFSCVFADKSPDWLKGKSEKYSSDRYLLGIGIGTDIDSARSSARAEISKIFKVRVSQSAQESKTESSSNKNKKENTESSLKTSATTDAILQGVEIPDIWFDNQKKTYYALAILDKSKFKSMLFQQIAEREEGIKIQLEFANKAISPIEKLRALNIANRLLNEKDSLIEKRIVVESNTLNDLIDNDMRIKIQQQRHDALSNVPIFIDINSNEGLYNAINEKVASMGFKVVVSTSAIITIKSSFTIEGIDRGNPRWIFYKWKGFVEVLDGNNKSVINRDGEVSDPMEDISKIKAIKSAYKGLSEAAEDSLKKYTQWFL